MHRSCLLESIVTSLDDARAAAAGGADRFEFCSGLALGGLTPGLGTLRTIKRAVPVPVMCMIRPREGGMAYSEGEFSSMQADAETALDAGADGLVFGFLTDEGEVDVHRCRTLVDLARRTPDRDVETVFHRAYDVSARPEVALEQLIDLGITRVLTSGRAATAMEGIAEIRRTIDRARGRIQVLPGGGIDATSAPEVVRKTGADQIHLYLSRFGRDPSAAGNPRISFGAFVPESELEYRLVDEEQVRRARELLARLDA